MMKKILKKTLFITALTGLISLSCASVFSSCSSNAKIVDLKLDTWQESNPEGIKCSHLVNVQKNVEYHLSFNLYLFANKIIPPTMYLAYYTLDDEPLPFSLCKATVNNLDLSSDISFSDKNYFQFDYQFKMDDILSVTLKFSEDSENVNFMFQSAKPQPQPKQFDVYLTGDDKDKISISKTIIKNNENFIATLAAIDPEKSIDILNAKMNGNVFTTFTYNKETKIFRIEKEFIVGDLEIQAVIHKESIYFNNLN